MKLLAVPVLACALSSCRLSQPQASTGPPFEDAAERTGLTFRHRSGALGQFRLPEIMGSGVALLDYDGDGDLDIYLIQEDPEAGGNRMFRNEIVPRGMLTFTDVSEATHTNVSAWGMGVAVADYDADGDPDLFVTNVGRNMLLRNDHGTFVNVTPNAGVGSDGWHTSAAFFDYDRDGDLDLYVCRYVDFSASNMKSCRSSAGDLDYCTPRAYRPLRDLLFRNEGTGKFTDVSAEAGIARSTGPGLGVVTTDFDHDGWPDVYVANDGDANLLWRNDHDGTFRNIALEAGVAFSDDGMPQAGMGIAAGDYDNDGDEDLVVTNLTREGATLYRNDGNGGFSDVSAQALLRRMTFAGTGFGAGWLDYDSDGCLDLFVANGAVTVIDSQRGQSDPFRQRSQLLRGTCGRFAEQAAFSFEGISRGVAFGDLDRNGSVDIVVTTNNGPVRMLLNRVPPRQWLRVDAPVGSTVSALDARGWHLRTIRSDGSYLSSSESAAYFTGSGIQAIRIRWPEGAREQWNGLVMNQRFAPKRGTGVPVP